MRWENSRQNVLPGPRLKFYRRTWSAFQVFGCLALALGVVLNLGLGARLNLPLAISVVITLIGLLTIPVVALVTKIISGEEQLCFYHHLIAVLGVTSILLWLLSQPLLPFLDVLILACGGARALGYLGCLLAGCCHGRPCRWGFVYQGAHASAVPQELLGVRLFPIQVVESLWTFGVVVAGCVVLANPHPPGAGLAWFIATYCPARFCFEFGRWPSNYRFKSGLSQFQWTSLILMLFVVCLELVGLLPFRYWHSLVLALLLVVTAAVMIERLWRGLDNHLNHPDHVRELIGVIDLVWRRAEDPTIPSTTLESGNISLSTTSLGLQISASRIPCATGLVYHYAFSSQTGKLSATTINSLAKLIVGLKRSSDRTEVLKGSWGVFHLLIHSRIG